MMPTDRTAGGAASEVVKAVLDVTPLWDGEALVRIHHVGGHPDLQYGPAEPIAARQAAAVLRWLAEYRRVNGGYPAWTPGELDELADEIDGGTDDHR
jgi:hypothetical protein